MTSVAQGFVGARLTEARRARGISGTDLADLVGVSAQSISKYENEKQRPKIDMVRKLAMQLNMSPDYFLRHLPDQDLKPVFWRAKLSAPPVARDRAAVRLEWMKEIVDYLTGFFDFPELNVPEIDLPDGDLLDSDFIEDAAAAIRDHWDIPAGPMPDVIEQLETNGVLVSRIHVRAEKLDAFSQWSDRAQIPLVMLSRDKASAARQRFDAAHELVHIAAHRSISQKHLNDRALYKLLERQADQIASAVLLPSREFLDELYAPSLDGFLTLKERWGVSVGAMIMRCKALGILDDESVRRLFINYTRRGWRKGEPLDGKMEKECPHLIRRSFEMLLDEEVRSVPDVLKALPFPPSDIEEIADLEPGTLSGDTGNRREPVLKSEYAESNVVQIFGGSS